MYEQKQLLTTSVNESVTSAKVVQRYYYDKQCCHKISGKSENALPCIILGFCFSHFHRSKHVFLTRRPLMKCFITTVSLIAKTLAHFWSFNEENT